MAVVALGFLISVFYISRNGWRDFYSPTHSVPHIVAVVDACSEYFARRHEYLQEAYLRKDYKWAFLNDPELHSTRRTGAA
jgi:hypothetical protein